jgi:hypothetical protein
MILTFLSDTTLSLGTCLGKFSACAKLGFYFSGFVLAF